MTKSCSNVIIDVGLSIAHRPASFERAIVCLGELAALLLWPLVGGGRGLL